MLTFKVVIWGHKLHSHTHSYIHSSYYKAFSRMGYETYWLDGSDSVNINFENTIFLTEGQVDKNIPLNKTSFYILHHCDIDKYKGYNYINLCNYVNDCKMGISPILNGNILEKIKYYTYWDNKSRSLYQPWATDIFPGDFGEVLDTKRSENVYYVGSVWYENMDFIERFKKSCIENKKNFINIRFVSDEENRNYVKDSYISPDIRCQHHINVGYIPCRIFKNISYGVTPATNSKFVRDFFPGISLPYSEDCNNLFNVNSDFIRQDQYKEITKFLMNEVKENHTFINRAEQILNLI